MAPSVRRDRAFTVIALASLATCFAFSGEAPAVARQADGETTEAVRQCTHVRGAGHIGAVGATTQHLDMKIDLTVGGGEDDKFTWRQTGPGGALALAGYGFKPETVTCEAFTGGFLMRASGMARFRLSAHDTREAGEEVIVEEHLGSTTIDVGGRAPGTPGPLPPLELPASRWGPAVRVDGPSGTLNHDSLHAF